MSEAEILSLAAHGAVNLVTAIERQLGRLQSTPVTRAELLLGTTEHGFDFAHFDRELARLEKISAQHPGAIVAMSGVTISVAECVEQLRGAIGQVEAFRPS